MLLTTSVIIYLGMPEWMWVASIISAVLMLAVAPMLPRQKDANHKVALIGSRFCPPEDDDVVTNPTSAAALADAPMSQA